MNAVPLFTRNELAAAFRLLLSPASADRWAREWFDRFADDEDLDSEGYYLYRYWWDEPDETEGVSAAGFVEGESMDPAQVDYGRFLGESENEIGENLMRFSDFHFGLLALVSTDLFERVRAASKNSLEQAEVQRKQMRRMVECARSDQADTA